MDRREVDDVEAELGELREHLHDALEAAERAREELVPGAEAPDQAVDVELERVGAHDPVLVGLGRGETLLDRQLLHPEDCLALGELAREVLVPGLDLAAALVPPGRRTGAPPLHAELPPADRAPPPT